MGQVESCERNETGRYNRPEIKCSIRGIRTASSAFRVVVLRSGVSSFETRKRNREIGSNCLELLEYLEKFTEINNRRAEWSAKMYRGERKWENGRKKQKAVRNEKTKKKRKKKKKEKRKENKKILNRGVFIFVYRCVRMLHFLSKLLVNSLHIAIYIYI